ncbi:PIN domain-containing protein [Bifidobacterium longum]|uniref:PIN domain-containing protein n=1 Tax=Bifidobacterium longum TaxID=216816 RepID=UPI001C0171F2|nr:PIN domain-containing protein [Bifidobacterium longum]
MNSMAQHTSHASINDPEVLPTPETVVLDANIFPSTWLTDLFLSPAEHTGLLEIIYSDTILEESRRAMIDDLGFAAHWVDRYLSSIQMGFPYSRVVPDPDTMHRIVLPDPDDSHVVAAAVAAGASTIVTYNLADFPESELAPYAVKALHPDRVLTKILCNHTKPVADVLREIVSSKTRPPRTMPEELEQLHRLGLHSFVEAAAPHVL